MEVAIRANSLEAVDNVEQKKNILMAVQTAKQRMLSAKSLVRRITSLLYVEALEIQLETEVVEIKAVDNFEDEKAKVGKLKQQARSEYVRLLSVMWPRTLSQHP